jgi:hypothetical protein
MSGILQNPGTQECKLAEPRGGVYGVAICLKTQEEKEDFFNKLKTSERKCTDVSLDEWKSIGENYYPLYWGKDSNLGFRLFEHTKGKSSSVSIRLCDNFFRQIP